jgi:hypothetical protein
VWALTDRRAAIFAVLTLFAAGCGGGSGGGSRPPTPATFATSTQSIGVGGGMVSVNFGIYTATVTVPAGALPNTTTVSITLYSTGHGPQVLQSTQRKTLALGTGATELAEIVLDTGGEAPVLPLRLSLIGVATPASGTSIRLAGYGTAHGFTDVDTVTLTANTAAEDDSILYPDASAASHTLYGFYEIPSANVLAPLTPVITAVGTNPAPAGLTTQFTASETNGNGFPYLTGTYTFALDNAALGTISASGLLSAGALDATGNIIITDTTAGRGNPSSPTPLKITSARPGATLDAFAFTGTISSTDQLTGATTTQPQTDAGTVTLSSTVGLTTTTGSTANVASSSMETDTYPRQTITTTTNTMTAYGLTPAAATVSLVSTDATDSNMVEYINTYGSGNGLLDVLPETAGAFGPNNAALNYQEYDPANYSENRVTNGDGSYTETDNDSFGDTQTISTNTDFSAAYDASQYSFRIFGFTAPAGSPATITISYTNLEVSNTPQMVTIKSWIPAAMTQPSVETDNDAGVTAFPGGCSVPAKYGTSGNKIVQAITRVDAALGNLENETITTYVNPSYGPVCTVMTDNVNTYYDYTGQYGYGLYYAATALPVETTSISETLTLSSATTSAGTLAQRRQTSSVSRAGGGYVPLAFARSRFERTVREHLKSRKITFTRDFFASGAHAK